VNERTREKLAKIPGCVKRELLSVKTGVKRREEGEAKRDENMLGHVGARRCLAHYIFGGKTY
jgi:hypothetical protein